MLDCTRRRAPPRGSWRPRRGCTALFNVAVAPLQARLPPQLQRIHRYTPDGSEIERAQAKQVFIEIVQRQMHELQREGSNKHMFESKTAVDSAIAPDEASTSSSATPIAFLGPAHRPPDVTVIQDALPEAFARATLKALHDAPESAWELLQTDDQMVAAVDAAQKRQAVKSNASSQDEETQLQAMRYARLRDSGDVVDREAVAQHVAKALCVQPQERLLLNIARYQEGDFLDSHNDHPSGNAAYDRHRAWVWHLSDAWDASFGGAFVDEETETRYFPRFNQIVHFGVPRPHRVERVTKRGAARYTAYGWIVTAEVYSLGSVSDLPQLRSESGGVAVVGWFGVAPWKAPMRKHALDLSEACLAAVGVDRLRGEYARFAITTNVEVAHALGLIDGGGDGGGGGGGSDGGAIGVVRWPLSRVDVLSIDAAGRSTLAGAAGALGAFIDEHRGSEDGVQRLDCGDHASMVDMYASPDVKVYIFVEDSELPRFAPTLTRLQAAHKAKMRLFTCDPSRTSSVMAESGVTAAQLPIALAKDVHGLHDPRRRTRVSGAARLGGVRSWLLAAGQPRAWKLQAPMTSATLEVFLGDVARELR